jgi:hypothetical protein
LSLEEAEKQTGYELDDDLKIGPSNSSSNRYSSVSTEMNVEPDPFRVMLVLNCNAPAEETHGVMLVYHILDFELQILFPVMEVIGHIYQINVIFYGHK